MCRSNTHSVTECVKTEIFKWPHYLYTFVGMTVLSSLCGEASNCCRHQMLAIVVLSQHGVLSSKTVRPATPRGVQCMEHAGITWFAVCLVAPHWQLDEGVRPYLYMAE